MASEDKNENHDNVVFTLSNKDNYRQTLEDPIILIQLSYVKIVHYYISHYFENMSNPNIFIQGFKSLTHIFLFLLMYTKYLELTIFHCQNSIFYYIEYISQITDKEDNMFFNLTLKDAIVYIYTKTIYDLNEECRQKHFLTPEDDIILKTTTEFTDIYGKISIMLATSQDFKDDNNDKKKEKLQYIRSEIESYIINQYKYDVHESETLKNMKFLLIECENQPNDVYSIINNFFNMKGK
jgi:hypothetical protein